jgi:hypothetical protein
MSNYKDILDEIDRMTPEEKVLWYLKEVNYLKEELRLAKIKIAELEQRNIDHSLS